jgi:phosphoribosylanthranilate isomerase
MDLPTLQACDDLRVDYVGFVFAKSKRQITLTHGIHLKEQAKLRHAKIVAVFKDMTPHDIEDIILGLEPDFIQLHNPVQVHFPEDRTIHAIAHHQSFEIDAHHLLIDSSQAGSGIPFDWSCLRSLQHHQSLWVAGGLNSENLKELFNIIRPFAVDISSGAETEGHKDITKIAALRQITQEVNHEL